MLGHVTMLKATFVHHYIGNYLDIITVGEFFLRRNNLVVKEAMYLSSIALTRKALRLLYSLDGVRGFK